MKLIRKGYLDPEGIFVTCQYCKAQYLIEDRNDFKVNVGYCPDLGQAVEYYVECPSCHYIECFGPIDNSEIVSRMGFLRKRPDWEERYKILPKEADKYLINWEDYKV